MTAIRAADSSFLLGGNTNPTVSEENQPPAPSFLDRIAPVHPLTGSRRIYVFPERLEIALGGYNYTNYIDKLGGPWDEDRFNEVVQSALQAMIPHTGRPNLPWKIKMVDTSSVNAWAKMGGFMGINRGIIQRMAEDARDFGLGRISMEDKIRAVIAHEMAHVSLRHSVRFAEVGMLWMIFGCFIAPFWTFIEEYLPFSIEGLLFVRYSRSQEFEADKYGMHLMWRCGFDPKAMIWAEHFLKDYEPTYGIGIMDWWDRLFWTHPTAEERIRAEEQVLAEIRALSPVPGILGG